MLRFLARHGLVRMIGGRAVPVLFAWDIVMLANRTRRIPIVDRNLRRAGRNARGRLEEAGAAAAARRAARRDERAASRAARADDRDVPDVPAT
jgi:hypothetical protein